MSVAPITDLTTEQRLAFRMILNRLHIEASALEGNLSAIIHGSEDVCGNDLRAIMRSAMKACVDLDVLIEAVEATQNALVN